MSKDKQINLRLESDKVEYLQIQAKKNKTSVTGMIIKIIDDIITGKATHQDMKIEILESELVNLRVKFEREFNKKIPKTHRISIAITDEEFLNIEKKSNQMKLTKSEVLRKALVSKKSLIKNKAKALTS